MGGKPLCAREAGLEGRHALARLEGVLRGDKPPDLVEAEASKSDQADMPVPLVRRVEGAAEKTDTPLAPPRRAGDGERAGGTAAAWFQGRTCPSPRTLYL